MKIFALYLRLNLSTKPGWFDGIRSKYSSTAILHITLIQPRCVAESDIAILKERVREVLSETTHFNKKLVFDKTEIEDDEKDGECLLMAFTEENKSIRDLQNKLVEKLKDFDQYCSETTKGYEQNFRPHLTIANQIPLGAKEEVVSLVSQGMDLQGEVADLVLAVVNEQTVAESEKSENWNVFSLTP